MKMKANYKKRLKESMKAEMNNKKRLSPKGLELVTQYADSSGIFQNLPEMGKGIKVSSKDVVMTELALLTLERANPKNVAEFSNDPEYFKAVLGIASDFPSVATFINYLNILGDKMDVSHILKSNAQLLLRNGVKFSGEKSVRLDVCTVPLDVNHHGVGKPDSRILAVAVIGEERFLCNMALFKDIDEWLQNAKEFLHDTLLIVKELTDKPRLHMKLQDWIPSYLYEMEQHTGLHVEAILNHGDGNIKNSGAGRVVCSIIENFVNLITGEPLAIFYWTNTDLTSKEIADLHAEYTIDDYMLFSNELRKDIGLAELSYRKTDANCLVVRLALLAYNILKLMGRKEGKVPCKRVRNASQWLIAVVG